MLASLLLYLSALAATSLASKPPSCDPDSIPIPTLFGTAITSLLASPVTNHATRNAAAALAPLPLSRSPISFCNVTVTYTHPNTSDSTIITIWLPPPSIWNTRFLAHGGGGLNGCYEGALTAGVSNGYASAQTDTGHNRFDTRATDWALKSPGNVDLQAVANFGGRGLDDMTVIAKQVVEAYYGRRPEYSYFSGCSQGGRQGLVLAQRYPGGYDGILAGAPVVAWAEEAVLMNYGQVVLRRAGYVPRPCELAAIHGAMVEECDGLDGVVDGVVSAPGLCEFDPLGAVGKPACAGKMKVTQKAAEIVNQAVKGLGMGLPQVLNFAMPFASEIPAMQSFGGLLQTRCDDENDNCEPYPFDITEDWMQLFVARDLEVDIFALSDEKFADMVRYSIQQYRSTMDADWPDLIDFKQAGGKMITWHGLSDQLLTPNITSAYYASVLAHDPSAASYYRHFEAPGVHHCDGGPGYYPVNAWNALVDWVEHGKAPDTLRGVNVAEQDEGKRASRPLCVWPKVARYVGGDTRDEGSFVCAEGFGEVVEGGKGEGKGKGDKMEGKLEL